VVAAILISQKTSVTSGTLLSACLAVGGMIVRILGRREVNGEWRRAFRRRVAAFVCARKV
jgi:hypothetical protein